MSLVVNNANLSEVFADAQMEKDVLLKKKEELASQLESAIAAHHNAIMEDDGVVIGSFSVSQNEISTLKDDQLELSVLSKQMAFLVQTKKRGLVNEALSSSQDEPLPENKEDRLQEVLIQGIQSGKPKSRQAMNNEVQHWQNEINRLKAELSKVMEKIVSKAK